MQDWNTRMNKKTYAKYNIERIMGWSVPIGTNQKSSEEYDKDYERDKKFKFNWLKRYFAMYFGLIKDGRKERVI